MKYFEWSKETCRALYKAALAHAGRDDKLGKPYILHCIAVADQLVPSETLMIAGLCHDMVEDTDTTLDDIEKWFGREVRDIVDAFTRRPDEKRHEFIERCGRHPQGRHVKIADLMHNMLPERVALLPRSCLSKQEQYREELAYLKGLV